MLAGKTEEVPAKTGVVKARKEARQECLTIRAQENSMAVITGFISNNGQVRG